MRIIFCLLRIDSSSSQSFKCLDTTCPNQQCKALLWDPNDTFINLDISVYYLTTLNSFFGLKDSSSLLKPFVNASYIGMCLLVYVITVIIYITDL